MRERNRGSDYAEEKTRMTVDKLIQHPIMEDIIRAMSTSADTIPPKPIPKTPKHRPVAYVAHIKKS